MTHDYYLLPALIQIVNCYELLPNSVLHFNWADIVAINVFFLGYLSAIKTV